MIVDSYAFGAKQTTIRDTFELDGNIGPHIFVYIVSNNVNF